MGQLHFIMRQRLDWKFKSNYCLRPARSMRTGGRQGRLVLFLAVESGHDAIAKLLLETGRFEIKVEALE